MGADFYASGLIGCEVTGQTETVTWKPSCEHNPLQTKQFCADCGKPVKLVEIKTPLPGLEAAIKAAGLSVASTTDGEREFVGLKAGSTDDATCTRIPDDIKDKVRAVLEPFNLWDEKSFGLWGIQFCSY
jgi:hypothetical protein